MLCFSIFNTSNHKNVPTIKMLNAKYFNIQLQQVVINNSSLQLDCKQKNIFLFLLCYFSLSSSFFSSFFFSHGSGFFSLFFFLFLSLVLLLLSFLLSLASTTEKSRWQWWCCGGFEFFFFFFFFLIFYLEVTCDSNGGCFA